MSVVLLGAAAVVAVGMVVLVALMVLGLNWLHLRLGGKHRHAVTPSDCPALLCRIFKGRI